MAQKIKSLNILGAMLCLLGLAACSSPTPTTAPTLDLNPFRTEVAATVLAQVTYDLALTPSITPIPSSTATSTATTTPVQPASASPSLTITLSTATLAPTFVLVDRAQWVSQSIPDDTVFAPGETFTMTWQLKNVGASTWTAGYWLRYYSGDLFGAPKEVRLGQEVLPGATIDISLKMKAPATPGKYRTDWVLSNETRSNFKDPVFLKITVALPPTSTRVPTATMTPTP
jgi:Ig-like domain from next to BRCA1 gene